MKKQTQKQRGARSDGAKGEFKAIEFLKKKGFAEAPTQTFKLGEDKMNRNHR